MGIGYTSTADLYGYRKELEQATELLRQGYACLNNVFESIKDFNLGPLYVDDKIVNSIDNNLENFRDLFRDIDYLDHNLEGMIISLRGFEEECKNLII